MSEWKAKRFWTDVSITPEAGGFGIKLDHRSVQTPAKVPLIVPTKPLAQAIAEEWRSQETKIDPRTMPFTRMANAAIDKVATQKSEVADLLAAYGDSDLLCYRAVYPAVLVERQNAAWDPLLNWATEQFGVRLIKNVGVMHQPQKPTDLAILSRRVHSFGNFELAAFHDLVSMSGSLIIGLAIFFGSSPAEELWQVSRIDELWQEEQWGIDDEAQRLARHKRSEFLHAAAFLQLCNHTD